MESPIGMMRMGAGWEREVKVNEIAREKDRKRASL
jgi:hypothetical protein